MTPSQVHKSAVLSINVFFIQITIIIIKQVSWLACPGNDKCFYSHDASMMSHWHDDDRIIAVQPTVICFSWDKQVSVAPKDVYRLSIFFFPLHYPLVPAVNTSAAVYILSHALDGLSREKQRVYEQVRRLWAYLPCHSENDGGLGGLRNLRLLRKSI